MLLSQKEKWFPLRTSFQQIIQQTEEMKSLVEPTIDHYNRRRGRPSQPAHLVGRRPGAEDEPLGEIRPRDRRGPGGERPQRHDGENQQGDPSRAQPYTGAGLLHYRGSGRLLVRPSDPLLLLLLLLLATASSSSCCSYTQSGQRRRQRRWRRVCTARGSCRSP